MMRKPTRNWQRKIFGSQTHNHQKNFWFFLLLLLLLLVMVCPVSSQDWDGVIVTAADFQALQAFKHELSDPKGFLRTWNDSGFGACSGGWAGIKCAQGQVIVIQLPWKGLGGQISEKVGQLQALRKLSLHSNDIEGPIPYSLGLLPNLRGVQLFNNRLSGSIPSSLGLSPILQTLDLANNSLSGNIPNGMANSTKLLRLDFSYNSLSGSIPNSLVASESLIFLSLDHNSLSGQIPGEIGRLKSLLVLNLRGNRLAGRIPESIGDISKLAQLDLSYNNLTNEIPDSIGDLPNLTLFNVSYNDLSGSVPASLSRKFNEASFLGNADLCGYIGSTAPCNNNSIPSQGSEPPGPETPSSQRPGHRHHRKLSTKDAILIAAGSLLVVLLVVCCALLVCLLRKRKRSGGGGEGDGPRAEKRAPAAETETGGGGGGGGGGEAGGKLVHFDGPVVFTADDLLCATAEIMGKSTFGTVYKATLEDGHQVAVKRLREKITKSQKDFETEVNVLGRIRHPNLLALRAYYTGPKGEKLLVFDYVPRGSLATFLHARGPETAIDWPTRMRIAQGTARGMLYLHAHESLVHGNLTSNNILLDAQATPKVADFGLSRLVSAAAASTAIATAAALGYRAPELSKLKKANPKTDVYSLGVVMLELLTGKPPGDAAAVDGVDLPQWVASIVKEEWTNEVFDVELMRDASAIGDELLNTLKLALHCVDPSPSARPDVHQILHQLEEIRPPDGGAAGVSSSGDGDDVPAAASTSE